MLHFLPENDAVPAPYAEAVERLRSVRKALALVEMLEGRPKRDPEEIGFEALLPLASEPVKRCADGRSIRVAGAATAGIEALVGAESAGERPHPAAVSVLGDTLRRDLQDIADLFAGRA